MTVEGPSLRADANFSPPKSGPGTFITCHYV